MEANELRIGNYVRINNSKHHQDVKDEVFCVTGIQERLHHDFPNSDYSISLVLDKRYAYQSFAQFNEFVAPIPLTEEWLVNFEFELKADQGDMKYYELGRFGVKCVEGDEYYFYLVLEQDYIILNELLHVHDIQNVWHSLTCSDLTLNEIR